MPLVDHVAICPADLAESLRFYRDGLGLEVLFDVTFDADLEPLLGVATERVRTVFLGDPQQPDAGRLELLEIGGSGRLAPGSPAAGVPHRGACLISFVLPVEETLSRLADLDLGGVARRMPGAGGPSAVVVDPDGVLVEILSRVPSL